MKIILEHLAHLTKLLGTSVPVATLAAHTPRQSAQSADFSSLCEFLRSEGFENYISERKLADIPRLTLPALLFLQQGEAVVLSEIITRSDGVLVYRVSMPGGLVSDLTEEELLQKYLGYCWFVKPKAARDMRSELPEYDLPKSWFFKIIWRFKKYYYQIILATFVINILALISSLYVMNVYDRVIPNQAYETLWVLSIGVMLAIGFELLAKTLRAHLTDIAGKKADLIISAMLFRRVMALQFKNKPISSGSYANNLRDFESVREFMTSASLLTLVDLPFLLLFLSVIGIVGGKLVIVPLVIVPLVIIIGVLAQVPLSRAINFSMRESSQRQGLVVEAIEGIETIKNNNAFTWAQKRWDRYTAASAASGVKVKHISNLIVNLTASLQQLNTVFLVLVGTYLAHSDNPSSRITTGALIASVILSGRALAPLGQIAGLATRFQQAWVALKGVSSIVERPVEKSAQKEYVALEQVNGQLSFENVHFHYDNERLPALNDFSLTIRAGEKVGILGKIGSGKSTALKLAVNLYQAEKGVVSLDGIHVSQLDPFFLRNQVLLLEQNPRLFLGTLRENLDLARQDGFADDHDLLSALHQVGLLDWVRRHPRGLDMPLGEDGMGLSGGQKQAVAIARMFLRQPKVVLLDEPTSALDRQSEVRALQAIYQWSQQRTMVVVTHRPQVLQITERVIVVENGRILMDGPRDEILQRLSASAPQNQMEQKS